VNLAPTVKVWMGEEKPQNFKGRSASKIDFLLVLFVYAS